MYLNERAWATQHEDTHAFAKAMVGFLDIYAALAGEFKQPGIYVPEDEAIYIDGAFQRLPISDKEYERLYLSFMNRRIPYKAEDEYEVTYEGKEMKGATMAALHQSFIISLPLDDVWQNKIIEASMYSLKEDTLEKVAIDNVFEKEQLYSQTVKGVLERLARIDIYSYDDLWNKRTELFPNLRFCPSVKKNFNRLDRGCLNQVLLKLTQLDKYCAGKNSRPFDAKALPYITPESESTLQKYKDEHTFSDDQGQKYLASWHIRFTGIEGRIFFVPDYEQDCILICHVGGKLPNVSFPT